MDLVGSRARGSSCAPTLQKAKSMSRAALARRVCSWAYRLVPGRLISRSLPRGYFSALSRSARRDFLRATVFLCKTPDLAALSKAEQTCRNRSEAACLLPAVIRATNCFSSLRTRALTARLRNRLRSLLRARRWADLVRAISQVPFHVEIQKSGVTLNRTGCECQPRLHTPLLGYKQQLRPGKLACQLSS